MKGLSVKQVVIACFVVLCANLNGNVATFAQGLQGIAASATRRVLPQNASKDVQGLWKMLQSIPELKDEQWMQDAVLALTPMKLPFKNDDMLQLLQTIKNPQFPSLPKDFMENLNKLKKIEAAINACIKKRLVKSVFGWELSPEEKLDHYRNAERWNHVMISSNNMMQEILNTDIIMGFENNKNIMDALGDVSSGGEKAIAACLGLADHSYSIRNAIFYAEEVRDNYATWKKSWSAQKDREEALASVTTDALLTPIHLEVDIQNFVDQVVNAVPDRKEQTRFQNIVKTVRTMRNDYRYYLELNAILQLKIISLSDEKDKDEQARLNNLRQTVISPKLCPLIQSATRLKDLPESAKAELEKIKQNLCPSKK